MDIPFQGLTTQRLHPGYIKYNAQGRNQEFWWGGGGVFFSKAWNLGAALMPPLGPGQRLGGGPRGEAPGGS